MPLPVHALQSGPELYVKVRVVIIIIIVILSVVIVCVTITKYTMILYVSP